MAEIIIIIAKFIYFLTSVVWGMSLWLYKKGKCETLFFSTTIMLFMYGLTESVIYGLELFGLE